MKVKGNDTKTENEISPVVKDSSEEIVKTINDLNLVLQTNKISKGRYKCSITAKRLITFCMYHLLEYSKQITKSQNIKNYSTGLKEIDSITEQDLLNYKGNTNDLKEFGIYKKQGQLPVITFKIYDLLEYLNINSVSKKVYDMIREAVKECQKVSVDLYDTPTKYKSYNFFSYAEYDFNTKTIGMTFTPEITESILEYKFFYAALEPKVMGKLKTIEAARIYEYALSFRNTKKNGQWDFYLSKKAFATLCKLPEYTLDKATQFTQRYIEKSIKDINNNSDLMTISYTVRKDRKKIIGYELHCIDKLYDEEAKTSNLDFEIKFTEEEVKNDAQIKKTRKARAEKKSVNIDKEYVIDNQIYNTEDIYNTSSLSDKIDEEVQASKAEKEIVEKLKNAFHSVYLDIFGEVYLEVKDKFSGLPNDMIIQFTEKEAERRLLEKYSGK